MKIVCNELCAAVDFNAINGKETREMKAKIFLLQCHEKQISCLSSLVTFCSCINAQFNDFSEIAERENKKRGVHQMK